MLHSTPVCAPVLPCALSELGQNLLKELPLEVSQLQRLKKLGLPSNLLKAVPPQVAGLEVLEWL